MDGYSTEAVPYQYPDPDDVAYGAQYPWAGEEGDYVPAALQQVLLGSWDEAQADDDDVHLSRGEWPRHGLPMKQGSELVTDEGDESIGHNERLEHLGSLEEITIRQQRATGVVDGDIGTFNNFNGRTHHRTWPRGRGARRGGLGRGARGIKRGLRNPIEPEPEFKALHSQATMAFIANDYDEAETLTLQALQINPEMYPAHSLLSQIHAARGDPDKALVAAWNGAHTRPRDTEMWSRIAGMLLARDEEHKTTTLRDAIYCYTRIISVDKHNVEARYQRAALNRELGKLKQVVTEYEQLIKYLPHDTTVLRYLAQVCIEMNEPERALRHYRTTASYLQDLEPAVPTSFTWSDVNVMAELHMFNQEYNAGLEIVKSLSRWLLGRRNDRCWENFTEDDREWDIDDQPRRIEISSFVPNQYESKSYGNGLPLDLRVKLGLFRLKSTDQNLEEALNHFEWLDPDDSQIGAKIFDYPDLFQDAAKALLDKGLYQDAVRYYEPLQQVANQDNASYLSELATCYIAIGRRAEAEECYRGLLNFENENSNDDDSEYENERWKARIFLGQERNEAILSEDEEEDNMSDIDSVASEEPATRRTRAYFRINHQGHTAENLGKSMLAPTPAAKRARRLSPEKEMIEEESLPQLFSQRQALARSIDWTKPQQKEQWLLITKNLIRRFMVQKAFFPEQRHHEFMGYTRQARHVANRKIREKMATVSQQEKGTDDAPVAVPDTFGGIAFADWLDIFLQYGLMLAVDGNTEEAYKIMVCATQVSVFYHCPDSLFMIHVCWCTCALLSNDNETLCGVTRWFMKDYQFTSDAYRLFSAVNRLSDCDHGWFNCGPSQKHVLRQVKAMDYSLAGDGPGRSNNQERSAYTARDQEGKVIMPQHMDVSLLMLYGHILYAGKSYAYANNYFLRALSVDPTNSVIKLSLALGYIHHALKRQADNRHQILMQGFALLFEYHHQRQEEGGSSERQEAAYNVARAYHMLGLTHLATPYYEHCLFLSEVLDTEYTETVMEDFAQEAAFALQEIWATNGNEERALEVTERWLQLR